MTAHPHLAAPAPLLYGLVEALPRHLTGEIVAGSLHAQARPAKPHRRLASRLLTTVSAAFEFAYTGPGGWIIDDEPELHLVRDREVYVPDIAGWRVERAVDLSKSHRVEIAPDWVCEILSPATRSLDREVKVPAYARFGVGHVWLADPEAQTVEAFRRDGTGTGWIDAGRAAAPEPVRLPPFDAVALAFWER